MAQACGEKRGAFDEHKSMGRAAIAHSHACDGVTATVVARRWTGGVTTCGAVGRERARVPHAAAAAAGRGGKIPQGRAEERVDVRRRRPAGRREGQCAQERGGGPVEVARARSPRARGDERVRVGEEARAEAAVGGALARGPR